MYWFPYSSHTSHHPTQTPFLPSLNLLCYSKTDARFSQDCPKAVWSIPYVSVAFCPSLKQNFIAYRSSKVSDCIFEIQQLWQSGFSRVYSNFSCTCSFEREIIKISQSSHKMYSNNILNFQESTTILNAHEKKVWKLIEDTKYIYIYIQSSTDKLFVVSQLFSVARHTGRFKPGSKPAQLYVRLSILPLSQQATYVNSGIITYYVLAFFALHFALQDTRVLNSVEELCITLVATVNFFARVLYIYIYILKCNRSSYELSTLHYAGGNR